MKGNEIVKFREKLLKWYQLNKRDLPWRNTHDPYRIWISEIILQQTRVNQGLDYYLRFVEVFPTIRELASALEDDVLKLWQGLGYYSRARNMYKTANIIYQKYDGVFPDQYKDLIKLPGIGTYTAAAICSIAYSKPYPVIDGNVIRVISRIFGIDDSFLEAERKNKIKELAAKLLDHDLPGDYNQAIMEYGAVICKPKSPECHNCFYSVNCFAKRNNKVEELPVKYNKPVLKKRYMNYFVCFDENRSFLVKQRSMKDIWQGLYDFPLIELDKKMKFSELKNSDEFTKLITNINIFEIIKTDLIMTQKLSHQMLEVSFHIIDIGNNEINMDKRFINVSLSEFLNYPVPKMINKFLQSHLKNYDYRES